MSLFATTQKLVEETLFYWTKEWVPQVLTNMKWQQPEQTELNYWFRSFDTKRFLKDLVVQALAESRSLLNYDDLRKLLQNLQHIRHAAVHRKQYNMLNIRELMADARRITRLEAVIGIPIEDFNVRIASLDKPEGEERTDGNTAEGPVPRKYAESHNEVNPVEKDSDSSGGFQIRQSAKYVLPDYGTISVIDLTEDGDDNVFDDARNPQPIVENKSQKDAQQCPTKRADRYVGKSFIEISDTESGKESGEIDEDEEDDDDEGDTTRFSSAPRMYHHVQYMRPRLGKDF
ncbi:hypothetical protein ONS95_001861 [Cadophora gregata]|uniref:uncharacterized protein n=1 Tax=Cadophora gregata TaxID=51156 RepID=UPI0026DB49EB|nr:uncharacterized protein ONS95_001861 [Cadophora gregata]KAK0111506.1 hypothetical protein ONS95_001861 [Cadophora gregata]KAK0112018.1 hypothetical protein ONS96_001279 [Cadophora gregata f. sp. sojae]